MTNRNEKDRHKLEIRKLDKQIKILTKKRELFFRRIAFIEHNEKVGEIEEDKGGWSFFSSEGFSPRKFPHVWYVTIPASWKNVKRGNWNSGIPFGSEEEAVKFSEKLRKSGGTK